jgi:plasmid maintenance system antidote protein VapI
MDSEKTQELNHLILDFESNSANKTANRDLHHGKILEKAVRKASIGISEIARKLSISRKTIYNWFETERISIVIIKKVGRAIGHDFSIDLPDEFDLEGVNLAGQPFDPASNSIDSKSDTVYYWMERYIKLLEDMNQILSHSTGIKNQ